MSISDGNQAITNNNVEKIQLCVKGQDGSMALYQLPRNVKLHKLMTAYCKKKQLDIRTARFIYDGHRVQGNCTANELNLEDGDEICCMLYQRGAGFYTMPKTT